MKAGNRKQWIVGFVVLVVVVLVAVAVWPGPKEPEYQGKKLSEWLEMHNDRPAKSTEAVRAIGTNAIPFLVRWIGTECPAWKRKIADFYTKHPGGVCRS